MKPEPEGTSVGSQQVNRRDPQNTYGLRHCEGSGLYFLGAGTAEWGPESFLPPKSPTMKTPKVRRTLSPGQI